VKQLGNRMDHYWRVLDMASALGIDLGYNLEKGLLSGHEWASIVERCRACEDLETCSIVLSTHEPLDEPLNTCPNAEIFSRLLKH